MSNMDTILHKDPDLVGSVFFFRIRIYVTGSYESLNFNNMDFY